MNEDKTMKEEFVAHYVMYTHDFFLEDSIESVYPFVDKILIARTTKPWHGGPVSLEETENVLKKVQNLYGDKLEIYSGQFPDEQTQRNFLIQTSKKKGHLGAFIVDCDEVFIGSAFKNIYDCIRAHNPNGLAVPYLTFIKDASFCVAPPYEVGLFYLNLTANPEFTWGRICTPAPVVMRYDEPEILHFSYVREKDEDILKKIQSFMHANDTDWEKWYRECYVHFHPRLKNFHPTLPEKWRALREFDVDKYPPNLRAKLQKSKRLTYVQHIKDRDPLKLHLGCGGQVLDGYVNVDMYSSLADMQMDMTDLGYFDDNSVDEIFMNAVFEHLYAFEQKKAVSEWYRVLKPNGSIIIRSIPDFDEVVKAYTQKAQGHRSPQFDLDEVFGYTHGGYVYENRFGQMHKDIFTKVKVKKLLEEAGFDVLKIENVRWKDEPNPVNINVLARKPLRREDEAVQPNYLEAQRLIGALRYDEAAIVLENILKMYPLHSSAHDDLGALYYRKGDRNQAFLHFIQAMQADPDNINALKNLADLCMELGHHEEAIQFYRKILVNRPEDGDALFGVGSYCDQTGQAEDARLYYRKVLDLDPEHLPARSNLERLEEALHASRSRKTIETLAGRVPREIETAAEKKLVSIITAVHNQLDYTQKCLESIFTHTNIPFELIVVDNGSTDGTGDYLNALKDGRMQVGGWRLRVDQEGKVTGRRERTVQNEDPNRWGKVQGDLVCTSMRVICNDKNLGFCVGNNQGIALAQGDYLLLLNNDTVVTPGWLNRLIAAAERKPEIGIAGPMSNYVDGAQRLKEIGYDPCSLGGLDQFAQAFAEAHAGQREPIWRSVGFCMLIKRAVVETIGGLDERYGVGHFEDEDFCLRAALAGFRACIAKDCFIHHFGNRTFKETRIDYDANLNRNWDIFKKKWGVSADVAFGDSYDLSYLLKSGFTPEKHYCPLGPPNPLLKEGEERFTQGDLEGAKRIFEESLAVAPADREVLNNLGVVASQQNEVDRAISYFRRALHADPSFLDAAANLGNCLMLQRDYEGAIPWLQKALDLKPDDLSVLNTLANCYLQIEDFTRAEEIYGQSYQLDGQQVRVGDILAGLERLKALGIQRRMTL